MKRAAFGFSPPGRMLFRFAIDAQAMRQRFGAPHYGENGPRGMPAWGFELEDGTTFELHFRDTDGTCYVNGDLRDVTYLMARLDVADALDRLDADDRHYMIAMEEHFPSWQRRRVVDDTGTVLLETPSAREAAWFAVSNGGRVVLEDSENARQRRDEVADARNRRSKRPPPPVRRVSTDGTWELWRITRDGGRSLLGVYEDRTKAEELIAAAPNEQHELVPRGRPES